MRKWSCFLLAIALLAFTAGSLADDAERVIFSCDGYEYTVLEDGTAEIVSTLRSDVINGTAIIPETLDGYKVTKIGDYAYQPEFYMDGWDSISKIVIPETVTTIGNGAFYLCWCLESITIPDSVSTLDGNPFYGCSADPQITISPDHPYLCIENGALISKADKRLVWFSGGGDCIIPDWVECIGEHAFDSYGINKVYIPATVSCIIGNPFGKVESVELSEDNPYYTMIDGVLFSQKDLKLVYYPKSKTDAYYTVPEGTQAIDDEAFSSCEYLTSLFLPSSISVISGYALNGSMFWAGGLSSVEVSDNNPYFMSSDGVLFAKNMDKLICYPSKKQKKEYTIPESVQTIGDHAFYRCENITRVEMQGVKSIGNHAFDNCSSLINVNLSNSIIEIGEYAFYGCYNLTNLILPESLTRIENGAFASCVCLKSITLPEHIVSIGYCAFSDCGNLTSVNIPNSLTSIGKYAFWCCSRLTSITLPDSLISIGDRAFSFCSSLTSITLPDSLTSIGDEAFWGCSSLTSITLPDSVTSIGDWAFEGCSNLTSITLPDNLKIIGDEAFGECGSLTSITLPDCVETLTGNPFVYCKNLETVQVSANHPYLAVIDGVLFSKADKRLVWCPMTKKENDYVVPQGTEVIGDSAFYGCSSLTSITIPDSVTSIGDWAFYDCSSLTSITLPGSVTSIGRNSFYNIYGPIIVTHGSYGEQYCQDNDLDYIYSD